MVGRLAGVGVGVVNDTRYQDVSDLRVGRVRKDTAYYMAVTHHYSKKWNTSFGTHNYGIYQGDDLLGIAVYGNAMNPASWPSVTRTPPERCVELNRLWISDQLGPNTETWFLARTFRLLRESGVELVQSFADGRLGTGITYQAANFTYHGVTRTLFFRRADRDEVMHGVPFTNAGAPGAMVSRNLLYVRGLLTPFYVPTFRYLYPLTKAARKAVLLPALPYPKGDGGEIPAPDYVPPASQIARAAALAEAQRDTPTYREFVAWLTHRGHNAEALIDKARDNPWVTKAHERHAIMHNTTDVPLFDLEGIA